MTAVKTEWLQILKAAMVQKTSDVPVFVWINICNLKKNLKKNDFLKKQKDIQTYKHSVRNFLGSIGKRILMVDVLAELRRPLRRQILQKICLNNKGILILRE